MSHEVEIEAPPDAVWAALTRPEQMRAWLAEPEVGVEVLTDWRVGAPIVIRGRLNGAFENRGTVLAFEPNALLRYTHLSSHSRLPDVPESYSTLEFRLAPTPSGGTSLTVTLSGFPTESIFRHLDFYWRGTVGVLKRFVEQRRHG